MKCPNCGNDMRTLPFLMSNPYHCDICDKETIKNTSTITDDDPLLLHSFNLGWAPKSLSDNLTILIITNTDKFKNSFYYTITILCLLSAEGITSLRDEDSNGLTLCRVNKSEIIKNLRSLDDSSCLYKAIKL